jgi:hypothetical protein
MVIYVAAIDYSLIGGERSPEQILRVRASVVAWLELRGMLELLTPEEALPPDVRFACEHSWIPTMDPSGYFLRLALRWPGDGRARARAWYVDQFMAAVQRGVDIAKLAEELIGPARHFAGLSLRGHATGETALARAILEDIAWRSFDEKKTVPWLSTTVVRALERRAPGAWERAFAYLDRYAEDRDADETDWLEVPYLQVCFKQAKLDDLVPTRYAPDAILVLAPAPEPPTDEFDLQLLKYGHLLPTWPSAGDSVSHVTISLFKRIASFPSTRARANRLLRMLLDNPGLAPRISGAVLLRVAEASDPVSADELPAPEMFLSTTPCPEPATDQRGAADAEENRRRRDEALAASIAAYKELGGDAAEERLRTWLQEPLAWDDPLPRSPYLGSPVHGVFERLKFLPELLTANLRRKLVDRAVRLPTRALADIYQKAPWLISEADLRRTFPLSAPRRSSAGRVAWLRRRSSWGWFDGLPSTRRRRRSS